VRPVWAGFVCAAVVFALLSVAVPSSAAPLPRSRVDRADISRKPQIHAIYVLPADGVDRRFDRDRTIQRSVHGFLAWLAKQTGGKSFRADTVRARGFLDVSFYRSARSDADIASLGPFVRDELEAELKAVGFDALGKIYAVYYDGHSTFACGGGAWPPELPGNVAALYLLGEPPGAPPCSTNTLGARPPGYFEFAMVHEIMHTMGFVPTCAPHQTLRGHVSDSPRDLMWSGDAPWQLPPVLDFGHDDYYRAHVDGCLDLGGSPFLTRYWWPGRRTR
jgi:hypothetical protein